MHNQLAPHLIAGNLALGHRNKQVFHQLVDLFISINHVLYIFRIQRISQMIHKIMEVHDIATEVSGFFRGISYCRYELVDFERSFRCHICYLQDGCSCSNGLHYGWLPLAS